MPPLVVDAHRPAHDDEEIDRRGIGQGIPREQAGAADVGPPLPEPPGDAAGTFERNMLQDVRLHLSPISTTPARGLP
jgi:hypothetical protein